MRRIAFIAVIAAAVGLSVQGAALARTHRGAHARHHARSRTHHKGLHARTLLLTPASVDKSSSSTASGSPSTSSPAADSIGTVGSFTNNMLVVNLNNGSTVSGLVDPNSTEFECESAPSQTAAPREDGGSSGSGGDSGSSTSGSGSGDNSGSGSTSGSGDQPATQPTTTQSGEDAQDAQENEQADNDAAEDQNEVEDQNQAPNQPASACNSSLLTPGTAVKEAELRISPSGGSTFEKIALFH